ncbi:DegT/DnrJ/EryC1/StrS family aminotransferase [Microvirga sp. M2]|uniref:DegT/DnrJ/EryC1/StrS family aminotransferase n=1 Tax=Microvirga sp. M2 TaxID=3073270 RepID=UPI0039C2DF5F
MSHAVLTPSGRGALFLLLKALPEGRVIVPGYTCSAVFESARLAGRDVVTVEHQAGHLNLAPSDIANVVQAGDIIIATHQYGFPCDVSRIKALADARGAIVIEDIAAALGAEIKGRPVGSVGLACFGSFDTSKLVHSPLKGGFVATDDAQLAADLKTTAASHLKPMPALHTLRLVLTALILIIVTKTAFYRLFYFLNFQLLGNYTAENGQLASALNPYYQYSFSEWQARVVLKQLRQLNGIIAKREAIYAIYRREIRASDNFDTEVLSPERPGSLIRFPIYVRGDKIKVHRRLARAGIDTGFSFTTIAAPREQTHAWLIAGRVLNLPFYTSMTARDVRAVVKAANQRETL